MRARTIARLPGSIGPKRTRREMGRPAHVDRVGLDRGRVPPAVEPVPLAVLQQRPVARARLDAVGAGPGVELIIVVPPDGEDQEREPERPRAFETREQL